jgi:EamA domain-containing membrane protein RarD
MGVFVFRERFSSAHAVCFGAIWTAIAVYLASKAGRRRKAAGEK